MRSPAFLAAVVAAGLLLFFSADTESSLRKPQQPSDWAILTAGAELAFTYCLDDSGEPRPDTADNDNGPIRKCGPQCSCGGTGRSGDGLGPCPCKAAGRCTCGPSSRPVSSNVEKIEHQPGAFPNPVPENSPLPEPIRLENQDQVPAAQDDFDQVTNQPLSPLAARWPKGWKLQMLTRPSCVLCKIWERTQMPLLSGLRVEILDLSLDSTSIESRYRISGVPVYFIVDETNRIRQRVEGTTDASDLTEVAERAAR